MTVKIKTIKISAFRGIPDLELELNGKNLLLRGENGTGKSSLVEAIEFFFTGSISHLEGTQSLSLKRHAPHVNFKPEDVKVELIFNPRGLSLNRTFDSILSPPEPLKDYFQITQKGTFILRRAQVLAFILSKPAERFRAIGSILGVDSLDEIELKMMRARDHLKGEIDSNEEKIGELIVELSTIIEKKITSVDDVLPALNEILKETGLPQMKSLKDVGEHSEEMLKTVKKAGGIDRISALNELYDITKAELIPEKLIGELNDLNDKVKHLLQEEIRVELSIATLLESGRRVIAGEEMDVCPLCEQKIDRQILLPKIDARLKTLRDLSETASEIRIISVPLINKLKEIANKLGIINTKIETFPELAKEKSRIKEKIAFLEGFVVNISSAKDLQNDLPIQDFKQQKNEINMVCNSISKKCNQFADAVGLTEDEKKVLSVTRLIEQAKSKTTDLLKTRNSLKNYKTRYDIAERIYSTFSETKKKKIQEIYNSIQENIRDYYSKLHPDDPHKNIELTVALTRRASTELRLESFGRVGEDPRALTSEGHLDSLGLCIFLGFVKKFNENCSLVVLDDVVSTIDASHRENICKLLLEEFREKQLIITTHDGIWYEQLRAAQRAYGMDGDFENLVITSWDVNSGLSIRPYKPRWERIQEKINSGDKTGAGNEGRQYLEWILEKICEGMQAPVPFKTSGKYEVSELLTPAKKRLDELIKDDKFKQKISETFRNLESTIIMGNLLSHNNILTENISIEEIKRFCEAVHNLYNAFLCPACEHFIRYYRDLKIIRCSNSRCENPIEVKTK